MKVVGYTIHLRQDTQGVLHATDECGQKAKGRTKAATITYADIPTAKTCKVCTGW